MIDGFVTTKLGRMVGIAIGIALAWVLVEGLSR
jgi:tetrahydromethanopterin S-methyltransferase subunit F